jgi:ABC-2 type transport system ATP-binding protein
MRASAPARWSEDERQNHVFEDVSKFYGEVLGVNRISLSIPPGITTLVGPNGSGKTTLMNLMTGLVQPSSGTYPSWAFLPATPAEFFRNVGYCTQFDFFPRGIDGMAVPYG